MDAFPDCRIADACRDLGVRWRRDQSSAGDGECDCDSDCGRAAADRNHCADGELTGSKLEENDSLVRVHVGSGVIADGVPPWIARRTEASDVATDAEQRQRFYQRLDESIFMAVDRFRTERERLR